MKFIFIAVNYNGSAHIQTYLESLQSISIAEGDSLEAIIVDNESTDTDLQKTRNHIAKYTFSRLIELRQNIGYFSGLNAGIAAASLSNDTMLIIGNNDLIFSPTFIHRLKSVQYEKNILAIAPNIVTLDGRRQNPHVVSAVSNRAKFLGKIYFSNYYIGMLMQSLNGFLKKLGLRSGLPKQIAEHPQSIIKRGVGACYILPPTFFSHFDRLDARVFMWGEEALFSNQLESVGGATLYAPSLELIHKESATVKFITSKKKYKMVRESYKIYKNYL